MNFTIVRFDEIESTNTEALNKAKLGAEEGLCVVARRQTKGRGRHGRVWISEKDAGLYFSLVLRPKIETRFLPLITLISAIAVSDVLRELYRLKPDIKWANDVHVNDRKICGILAEMTETSKNLAVVVGVGINLKSTNFPPELNEAATSIEEETEKEADAEHLLASVVQKFSFFYKILESENGADKIRAEWIKRSSYAFGKRVKVVLNNETIFGATRGIEENGALRLETASGEVRIIYAGDVEILRKVS